VATDSEDAGFDDGESDSIENGGFFADESLSGVLESEIQYTDSGLAYLIHPDELRGGGPSKGGIGVDRGIPALVSEDMNFVSVSEADTFIADNELVLAFHYLGEKRVYPLQIMVWHEIANDVVGGEPVLITYCPLCGSGIAYERELVVDGASVVPNFGTSGKLYNSNLVMYDDYSDTYWQQIDGKAIVGELVGTELVDTNIDTIVWRDYKEVHSDAIVLSTDTGMNRDYGRDPYGSYYEDSLLFFPVDNSDDSIHPKTVIYGLEIDSVYKAYIEEDIVIAGGSISDTVAGRSIVVSRDSSGIVTITDVESGEELVKERDFFFAWYAFHPNTLVYGR